MKVSFPDWRALVAEFLGTFVFVFVACGSVLTRNIFEDFGVVGVALATGVIMAALVFATVAISGGHLNPAITLATWLTKQIDTTTALLYVAAQVIAGFAAAFLLLFVFGDKGMAFYLGGPILATDATVQSALIVEAILTAVLVFVFFATMVEKQSLQSSSSEESTAGLKRGPVSFGPLAIGLVFLAGGIFAGPMDGAALNPVKVAPLIVSGHTESLLVWVVGPLAGALFGLVYEFLFLRQSKKK